VSGRGSPARNPVGEPKGSCGAPRHFPELVAGPPDCAGRLRLLSDVRLTEEDSDADHRVRVGGALRFLGSATRRGEGRLVDDHFHRREAEAPFQVGPLPDRNQGFAESGGQFLGSRLPRLERLQDLRRPFPPRTSALAGTPGGGPALTGRPSGVG